MQLNKRKGIIVTIKAKSARGVAATFTTLVLVLSPIGLLPHDLPADRQTIIVVIVNQAVMS